MQPNEFDVDAFIAGINTDKERLGTYNQDDSQKYDGINRLSMNARPYQGTLTFIPMWSDSWNSFYKLVEQVYEFYGDNSVTKDGEAWYKVLPLEYYGQLTPEQIELHTECINLLKTVNEKQLVDYNRYRVRTYTMIPGIFLKLTDLDGKKVDNDAVKDLVNGPCLFMYPNSKVFKQLGETINQKVSDYNGKQWIPKIFSRNATGRKGVCQIKFTFDANQKRYEASVGFEFNSEIMNWIDPDYEIPEDTMKLFKDDMNPLILGWLYDRDNKQMFNEKLFKELRDQLRLMIKSAENGSDKPVEESYENKNNLTPQAAPAPESAPRKTSPF